jgi:hypothetical protein
MAIQFVERVQARTSQSVTHDEILAAMRKIPPKSLSMEKVVTKVQQQRKTNSRRASRRKTTPKTNRPTAGQQKTVDTATTTFSPITSQKEPKTILKKLESVLQRNWERAQAEGLQPNRMSAEAFVTAIYQYTDRREGTRRRILQAAEKLDQADVLLTPALVADVVHELFES